MAPKAKLQVAPAVDAVALHTCSEAAAIGYHAAVAAVAAAWMAMPFAPPATAVPPTLSSAMPNSPVASAVFAPTWLSKRSAPRQVDVARQKNWSPAVLSETSSFAPVELLVLYVTAHVPVTCEPPP